MKKFSYVLIGNPNVGKSTIFNSLTGLNVKTGNYHGVTVGVKKSAFLDTEIVDLPGIYNLPAYSLEEKVSENYLEKNSEDIYVYVVESINFLRSITLLKEIINKKRKVILVLNLYDQLTSKGGKIDEKSLEEKLNIPVISINAQNEKDILRLKKFLIENKNVSYNLNNNFNVEKCFTKPKETEHFLDKIFFNKTLSVICFFATLLGIFLFTFLKNSPGDLLLTLSENLVELLKDKIYLFLFSIGVKEIIISFVTEVFIGGIGSVFCFLPQLMLLYFFITILEESGYLTRVAFMTDDLFSKIGLNGRAVFSIVMGFGCTAMAELSTKSFDNDCMRKKVALSLPFIPCMARLPIFAVIINTYFLRRKVLMIFAIYIISILLTFLTSSLLNKYIYKQNNTFIMEIPTLKKVPIKRICKILKYYALEFIKKVGSIILIEVTVLWILKSFSFTHGYVGNDVENSILSSIGKVLSIIFYPIGITDWKISVALLSGLFAKEAIVGTLELLYPMGLTLNTIQALAILAFCMTYTPCFSAIHATKKEIGMRLSAFSAIFQMAFALFFCYFVNIVAHLVLKKQLRYVIIVITVILFVYFLIRSCFVRQKLRQNYKADDKIYCRKRN